MAVSSSTRVLSMLTDKLNLSDPPPTRLRWTRAPSPADRQPDAHYNTGACIIYIIHTWVVYIYIHTHVYRYTLAVVDSHKNSVLYQSGK